MKRIGRIAALFLAMGLLGLPSLRAATPVAKTSDGYPNATMTIIVDSKAGSQTDVISRGFAEVAEKYAGVKIIIDNAEGGSGVMAMNRLLGKKADGLTMFQQSSTLPITIAVGQAPFKLSDFVPLAGLLEDYCVATVTADGDYQSLADITAFAKANPGKFNWGAAKFKASMHIFTLKIAKATGVKYNYIAYDSAADAKLGLMGGNVFATSSTVGIVREDVKAGKLKMVATTLPERSPEFPDVPTFKELGYDYVTGYSVWRGLFVKPGIPQERLDKLSEIVRLTCEDPAWEKFLKDTLQNENLYMPQAEFTKYVTDFYNDTLDLMKGL